MEHPSPSPKTRVIVVDDSLVSRSFVRGALEDHGEIQVVATAPNGRKALEVCSSLQPDLVVMDVEMPVMDGITALQKLREERPDLPAIIFTSTNDGHATSVMKVLGMAKTMWLSKPGSGDGEEGRRQVRRALCDGVMQLTGRVGSSVAGAKASKRHTSKDLTPRECKEGPPFAILAIGSSTGGPNALAEVVGNLPGDLGVPVVIVQHMPKEFTKHLASRLDGLTELTVTQGVDGEELLEGHVYIAPGGYHMQVVRADGGFRLEMNTDPPEHSCRPAVDPLLRSVVQEFGGAVLGVVLTGMGCDGAAGCESIRQAGGWVIVQDEATSVVWGMPGEVCRIGAADETRALDRVAPAICRALEARGIRSLASSVRQGRRRAG